MRVKRIVCFEWMPAAMSIETEAGAASHLRQLYELQKTRSKSESSVVKMHVESSNHSDINRNIGIFVYWCFTC